MTESPPTIAFDGAIFGAGPITGVGGSFATTLRAYARRCDHRCILLVPVDSEVPDLGRVEIVPGRTGRLERQRRLPGLLRELDASLLHSPVAALPLRTPCPTIATVHDLPWSVRPPLHESGTAWSHRLAVRWAARSASAIVVPTEATRRDLLAYAGHGCAPRVHVIPHGLDPVERPRDPAAADGPLLILGDDRPRKNHEAIRRAHALARANTPDLPDLRFVGPGFEYVDEAEKIAILRRSRALLALSRHEGFGLPILEAFAHGVPVLASDIPAQREVAGGAALLTPPAQVEAMAAAMIRIVHDEPLRRELLKRGRARANELTSAATADAWIALHRAIGAVPRESVTCT